MIIFDNVVYSLQESGGVSRFWSKITEPHLEGARFIERADAVQNIYRNTRQPTQRLPDHRLPKQVSRYMNFRRTFHDRKYIFHSSYYRLNLSHLAINVTTVHDLIYERFVGGLGSAIHCAQKRQSLALADCIVCVSRHTRDDLFKYYPSTRHKRVVVIHNGVDAMPVQGPEGSVSGLVRRAAKGRKFFLYVGHRGSCKGFDRVYNALHMCGPQMICIVVGADLEQQEVNDIAAAGLTDRVVALGRISDSDLSYLYSRAEFLFFPSLYEGFGIPPLEAMQHGCPVLASNRSAIPEVVGDAAVIFDPDDAHSLADGLNKIQSDRVRQAIVTAGQQRAASFSWRAASDRYSALYESLLNNE